MLFLFDLDGTIIDSEVGIFAGIRHSMAAVGAEARLLLGGRVALVHDTGKSLPRKGNLLPWKQKTPPR